MKVMNVAVPRTVARRVLGKRSAGRERRGDSRKDQCGEFAARARGRA